MYSVIFFIHRSNGRTGSSIGSPKGKFSKRGTKSSLLLPQSPLKNTGGLFDKTDPVGPSIVPVKEQPSSYTSDDITIQENRSSTSLSIFHHVDILFVL